MNQQIPEKDSLTLKRYFQMGIAMGLLVALVGGFIWLRQEPQSSSQEIAEETAENSEEGTEESGAGEEGESKEDQNLPLVLDKNKEEAANPSKVSEYFGQMMKPLAHCLGMLSLGGDEPMAPTIENLLTAVKEDLGEPILRSEDWVIWSLRVGNEERRLRLETDYSDNDEVSRRLRYFKIDPQGQPILLPLSNDQAKDPTEAFIASLQKDGELYKEEKGQRIYFEGGQEMVLTERDGRIDDLEVSNGSKTFRCAGILTTSPACKCY